MYNVDININIDLGGGLGTHPAMFRFTPGCGITSGRSDQMRFGTNPDWQYSRQVP